MGVGILSVLDRNEYYANRREGINYVMSVVYFTL